MIGIRWGIIASATAFIISLMLGFIAGNQVDRTFLTALVFGLLFFGIGFSFRLLVNNFFPELLFMENNEEAEVTFEQDNEKTEIVMKNTGEYAVPEMYRISGKESELGNIEDLISGRFSIDQQPKEVYNEEYQSERVSEFGELEDSQESIPESSEPQPTYNEGADSGVAPGFTPSFGDDEGLGGLPDLDAFTLAFTGGLGIASPGGSAPSVSSGVSESTEEFIPDTVPTTILQTAEPDRSQYKGNKPQELEGDFDAKEIAQGLRTLLKKDQ